MRHTSTFVRCSSLELLWGGWFSARRTIKKRLKK